MERFQNTGQPDWDWWGRLWPTPGETLRRLGVRPRDALAEIGAGNGYFTLPAARITSPAPVYALDLDESLLEELDRLADRQDVENVVAIHGDARDLDSNLPRDVDTVLLANTFHGISDPEPLVRAVAELLSPGGRFIVINWHDRPREETTVLDAPRGPPTELRVSPAETRRLVEDAASFERVRQVELPPYHYALCFER
ncbi:class I SAM-dependent methyltransferase [Halostella sp. JP-L12]|uniref:class I SAM-dependent methyltransferase n=1 Tax=Halostella TaxID=1843185 RepID=UPI000EF7D205|nr:MULTISPECIES: class I SAM-dependent methyltransferase [Halostella]NHN49393.1 class I SAM-dependent methyltransferase [Halostella sp. JP-L12]